MTICAQNRQEFFGVIENNCVALNPAGKMVGSIFHELPQNYPCTGIDEYIIMPNHIHAVITIKNIVGVGLCADPVNDNHKILDNGQAQGPAPTKLSLSAIIKRIKSLTTKKYIDGVKNNGWPPFTKRLWQRNFYDHIIRNDKSLGRIREYIHNNPLNWQYDIESLNKVGNMESELINV